MPAAYDPAIGRFTKPDTVVPEPGNPQALNRYSYVYNNPLRYTDSTGHAIEDWFNDSWKEEFHSVHGRDPDGNDYAYRFYTMAEASGMLGDYKGIVQFSLPHGADIDRSIHYAYAHGFAVQPDLDSLDASHEDFVERVKPGGVWDYKRHNDWDHEEFQDFGNFHYGVVAAAWGYPDKMILHAAGVVQFQSFVKGTVDAAVRRVKGEEVPFPKWHGFPVVTPNRGDDPRDQLLIELGMTFYKVYSSEHVREMKKRWV